MESMTSSAKEISQDCSEDSLSLTKDNTYSFVKSIISPTFQELKKQLISNQLLIIDT